MKIIIVGGGKTGTTLAHSLSAEGHDVTVIEKKADRVHAICDENDVMGIVANGLDSTALDEAGLKEADILIAVTASDEDNLLVSLFAKRYAQCDAIARVRNPLYIKETEFLKNAIGLSLIINPEYEAANSIERVMKFPSAVETDLFFDGSVEMLSFRIKENSVLDGESLMNVRGKIEKDVLFCTVEGENGAVIPQGSTVLHAGDTATVIIKPEKAAEFFGKIGIENQRIKNVMIAGGGRTGYYVAEKLIEMGMHVVLIEKDETRCDELSELLPEALVIHGDASDKALLVEEGIDEFDAFCAVTGFDEENIMLSLYAKTFDNLKVITKIDRMAFTDIIKNLDLDTVVYPRVLTDESILSYVRSKRNAEGSNVERVYKLTEGIEALEFSVGEKSPVTGKPLSQLALKDELVICGIFRDGEYIIPDGKTEIAAGDKIIVVTQQKNIDDAGDILG